MTISISSKTTHQPSSSVKYTEMNTYAIIVSFAIMAVTSGAVLPADEPVPILRQVQEVGFDGTFVNQFETANGIVVDEKGILKNPESEHPASEVRGSVSYSAPDGTPVSFSYVANENGAQITGSHIPTPPPPAPIPPAIARALEWIAAHPYVEPKQNNF